ncbi:MAG: phosphatase PAP2 family protein [Armatimonadota bacterium]
MPDQTQREKKDHIEALWLALSPVIGQLTVALLLALLAMTLFVKLAHEVAENETRQFDVAALNLFVPYRDTFLFDFMTTVSWLAGGKCQTVLVVLTIGFFVLRKHWLEAGTLLLADLGGLGVIIWLKRLFHRPRPEEVFSHLGYSFPSGHSFFAVVVYGLLAYILARDATPHQRRVIWGVATGIILLVGFSRIFVGEHFPSDVAAGFAVAIPWLWGCLAIPRAFHRRGRNVSADEVRDRYRNGKARLLEIGRHRQDLLHLTRGLGSDRRLPLLRRWSLRFTYGYLIMPIDLIPDFIPVLGFVDDILLVNFMVNGAAKAVSRDVIQEHWEGSDDLFALLERTHRGIMGLLNRE